VNISEIDEKLMEFIYDEYSKSSTFKTYGEFASVLVGRFKDRLRIELGDGGAQLEAMQRLIEKGWIEAVSVGGNRIGRTHLTTISRIKPTAVGIRFIEEKRQPWIKRQWPKMVSALAEGIIKGVKK